jgi:hypothetical protein
MDWARVRKGSGRRLQMSDRANKILGDARRRAARAEQALVAARNGVRAQEQIVARLGHHNRDAAEAGALLSKLREAAAMNAAALERAKRELAELSAIPEWKLNQRAAERSPPV